MNQAELLSFLNSKIANLKAFLESSNSSEEYFTKWELEIRLRVLLELKKELE